jgi:hypothetical protein
MTEQPRGTAGKPGTDDGAAQARKAAEQEAARRAELRAKIGAGADSQMGVADGETPSGVVRTDKDLAERGGIRIEDTALAGLVTRTARTLDQRDAIAEERSSTDPRPYSATHITDGPDAARIDGGSVASAGVRGSQGTAGAGSTGAGGTGATGGSAGGGTTGTTGALGMGAGASSGAGSTGGT